MIHDIKADQGRYPERVLDQQVGQHDRRDHDSGPSACRTVGREGVLGAEAAAAGAGEREGNAFQGTPEPIPQGTTTTNCVFFCLRRLRVLLEMLLLLLMLCCCGRCRRRCHVYTVVSRN